MAYRSFGRFRQASTHLDTPPFSQSHHPVSAIARYPGEAMLDEMGYEMLLPPLVHKVRQGVKAWRDRGYAGASATTRALLNHWFGGEHPLPQANGGKFRWYFAQREAVESAIWLYEVERARPLLADEVRFLGPRLQGHV